MELTAVQKALLLLVKTEFTEGYNGLKRPSLSVGLTPSQWNELLSLLRSHSMSSTVHQTIRFCTDIPQNIIQEIKKDTDKTVLSTLYLGSFSNIIIKKLEAAGIHCVMMKGPAISRYYPIPEHRKSGDADIAVLPEDFERACAILEANDFTMIRLTSLHGEYEKDGMKIELHRLIVEPLPEAKINSRLAEIYREGIENRTEFKIDELLPYKVFPEAINGLEIILHMLQHFIMGGFGIKLLCDWMVFAKHISSPEVCSALLSYLDELGLLTFVETCTRICVNHLGLEAEKGAPFIASYSDDKTADMLLLDAINAGEFQNKNPEYMVVLEDNSIVSLIKQFHYQMKHNHPKASKCVLLWPALWVITLIVFINNNKKLRHVKTFDIIKGAMNRAEGVSSKSLKLFVK